MDIIEITGPDKLRGKVKIQGAKNSAMKHIFIPLISEGKYTLDNIPKIGSIDKHLDLIKLFGSKAKWTTGHSVEIDTTNIKKYPKIPKELIYYTSGGNHIIPIIASKFGHIEVELDSKRADYGGDQIGSRNFDDVIKTLKMCGIRSKLKKSSIVFEIESFEPFIFNVPVHSFTATILALFSSLFKNGKSYIKNFTQVNEFNNILEFLVNAGAKISKRRNILEVLGPSKLNPIKHKNMNDPHDLVTWLIAALATNSKLEIDGIDFKKMRLHTLEKYLLKMNIDVDLKNSSTIVKPQIRSIKPIDIVAGQFPLFTTEWQVLIAPLLTQLNGRSTVTETFFANRMRHWDELAKMGIEFTYIKTQKYPEINNNPRAVEVFGPQILNGATVNALDVRTGASLIISALLANGKTVIKNTENIERGYEDITKRLKKLGVDSISKKTI